MDKEGLQRLFSRFSLLSFDPFRFGSSYGDIGVMLKCGWVVVLQVACWMLLAKQGIRKHHDAAQSEEQSDQHAKADTNECVGCESQREGVWQ
jgi:hypothetical protein